jgi:hypothetical protein
MESSDRGGLDHQAHQEDVGRIVLDQEEGRAIERGARIRGEQRYPRRIDLTALQLSADCHAGARDLRSEETAGWSDRTSAFPITSYTATSGLLYACRPE